MPNLRLSCDANQACCPYQGLCQQQQRIYISEVRLRSMPVQAKLKDIEDMERNANMQQSRAVPSYWMQAASAQAAANTQLVKQPLPGQEGVPDLPSTISAWGWAQLVEQVCKCIIPARTLTQIAKRLIPAQMQDACCHTYLS